MEIRRRPICGWAAFLVLVLLAPWSAPSALGRQKAPRRPPEPFLVFVHASDRADAALRARLEEAIPMVRERVERRRKWFQLVESAEEADVVLRIVNYRSGPVRHRPRRSGGGGMMPGMLIMETSPASEYHFVDAVVRSGGVSAKLSGLDVRAVSRGPILHNAAVHLAEELERFCKDNYSTLRASAKAREPHNPGASPRSRNASLSGR